MIVPDPSGFVYEREIVQVELPHVLYVRRQDPAGPAGNGPSVRKRSNAGS